MSSRRTVRQLLVAVLVGVLVGGGLMAVTPAGAEVSNAVATNWKKIWKKNLKPLADKRYYTKEQSNKKYQPKGSVRDRRLGLRERLDVHQGRGRREVRRCGSAYTKAESDAKSRCPASRQLGLGTCHGGGWRSIDHFGASPPAAPTVPLVKPRWPPTERARASSRRLRRYSGRPAGICERHRSRRDRRLECDAAPPASRSRARPQSPGHRRGRGLRRHQGRLLTVHRRRTSSPASADARTPRVTATGAAAAEPADSSRNGRRTGGCGGRSAVRADEPRGLRSPCDPGTRQQGRVRDACDPRRLRARRDDRGGQPAHLRQQHLQAGRRRRPARRLRVQPLRQPDAYGAGGRARGGRGRREGVRLRLRPRRRGHHHPGADPPRRPRRHPRRRLRRHASASSTRSPRSGALDHSPAPVADTDAVAAAIEPGPHQAGLGRDAHQPDAHHRRHRGAGHRRPRRRRPARRRQHLRLALPPAAAHARRRRGGALDDQVRRRAQRRRRRSGRRARPRARREDRLPPERHGRGRRTVRRLPDPPRPQDARRTDGPPLRQRGEDRGVPRRRPAGHRGDLPRPRGPPRPRGRGPPDEALRRDDLVPRRRRARAGPRASASAPRSSPSGSRSAASSRSSSTPGR